MFAFQYRYPGSLYDLEKIHITHKHISLATCVTLAESQMFGNWKMASLKGKINYNGEWRSNIGLCILNNAAVRLSGLVLPLPFSVLLHFKMLPGVENMGFVSFGKQVGGTKKQRVNVNLSIIMCKK